ncbi:hypothetical protein [Sphingobium yanoikuyae]|nr:hypothetical protein [Sphingobium yanoikuyae]
MVGHCRAGDKDIRAQKISNKLLIPGTAWTGAHNWVSSGNAAQAVKFVDPGKNYAFEVHQYLDAWSTGTTDKCEMPGRPAPPTSARSRPASA